MSELMSYNHLRDHLLSISHGRDRALLCVIYACMARVGEVVRGRYKHTRPLHSDDVKVLPNKIELYIKSEKGDRPRKVPVFRNRESWLIDVITNWIELNPGLLFDISTRRAEQIFSKWFPEIAGNRGGDVDGSKHTVHWLRGWRYSHYRRGSVTGKPVESKVASLLGGWISSAVPEKYYDLTKIEDYEDDLENLEK